MTDYTHTAPSGSNSLIDLVLTTSPSQVFRCVTIPPLDNPTAKSYPLGLCLNIDWKPPGIQGSHSRRRTVWRYAHADFEKASRMISETDWDALFSEDVDLYCIQWQQTFLSIMEECISKKVLKPRRCNLPWLNKTLVQSMRRRNCIFRKVKRTNNALHNSKYRRA